MANNTYLFSHTDKEGKNAAQARVQAKDQTSAREEFNRLYPQRVVTGQGVLGKS